jgi:hypothetical protein
MLPSVFSSIHLTDQQRRELFRQARQGVLESCGSQTITAEQVGRFGITDNPKLLSPGLTDNSLPAECTCVLMDGEQVVPLKVGINTIGRFPDCDLVIDEKHISRRHCVLLLHTNGSCELHDTASRNGTELNGQRLSEPVHLRSGDRIRVCHREFTFMVLDDLSSLRGDPLSHDTICE